jgi:hypothetical protein
MGEADEAPSVFSGLLYIPGYLFDDLYWGLILPMDGSLKMYYDKTAYIQKKPPKKVFDLS